jgi:hypothetical protein
MEPYIQQFSVEQTWLDEDTALKAAARKGWGFESLLLRVIQYVNVQILH